MKPALAFAALAILAAPLARAEAAAIQAPGPPACATRPDAILCQLDRPLSKAQAEARLGGKSVAWWVEGEVLTVIALRKTDTAQLCCAIQGPLERVLGSDDLWTAAYRIRDLDRAVIDILIFPTSGKAGPPDVWRGPAAPPAPTTIASTGPLEPVKFAGIIKGDTIESSSLGASRGLTIYLPPGFDPARRYPVVYMADGQSVREVATILEPLILGGQVRPTVAIGLHNAPDPQRARDYLPAYDGSDGFARHDAFLLQEVMPLAEAKYGASSDPRERLVLGYSNGAAWAVETAMRHPDLFANAAGLSFGWSRNTAPPEPTVRPRLFLAAGTLESSFLKTTTAYAERARAAGYQVKLVTPVSGHAQVMWEMLYPQVFEWAFPARAAP